MVTAMRLLSWSGLLLGLGMLLGCYPKGDSTAPIPTLLLPASQTTHRLVVVLPGRADDLQALRDSGVATAIQSQWPDADVLLTGLALGYYFSGNATQRLDNEIMAPARTHGYDEIWLLGASLGGMGALMYDREHPGSVAGIVLLAPYLGEAALLDKIRASGGLAKWNPGPRPASIDQDNFQRELWRHLQTWSRDPRKAENVWLAYGDRDSLRSSMPLLVSLLPKAHVFVREGGHAWSVWTPATRDILAAIDRERASQPSP